MTTRLTTVALFALVWSSPALACPVCGGGGLNRQAYIDTMIFMTVLPLMLLGGVAAFFWWKLREQEAASDTRTS